MDQRVRILLDKAFRVVPGGEYNEVRRQLVSDPEKPGMVCEAVVPDGGWEKLKEAVYPAQCRYLKVKGVDPANPGDTVVALFHEDSFHLVRGGDFITAFLEIEGIDPATFRNILSGWLDPDKAVLGSKIELLA